MAEDKLGGGGTWKSRARGQGDRLKTRRSFLVFGGTGLCLLATPLACLAQQQGKVWRVGFFYFGSRQSAVDTGR